MAPADEIQITRPWVDWTAGQIRDPLTRLRYLRWAAPYVPTVTRRRHRKIVGLLTLLALMLIAAPLSLRMLSAANPASLKLHVHAPVPHVPLTAAPIAGVWPVETTDAFEIYSNGLRIENQYAVSHRPRAYLAYAYDDSEGLGGVRTERRQDPAGIVYHTTESLQAPFEPGQTNVLKRVGESLIEYVRRRRCYHFLIDRFGRVFRIVKEADAADHAGHSVWADGRYFYVNLNDSFIGISFEAQTGAGESVAIAGEGQVRAAAMLTEMLRSRYRIPGENCVTHAQVSVNPSNMRIGYHLDWASSFPFERLGLPDNYATASPAVSVFGFSFDSSYQERAGGRLTAGASVAEAILASRAQQAQMSLAAFREALHRRYVAISRHAEVSPGN